MTLLVDLIRQVEDGNVLSEHDMRVPAQNLLGRDTRQGGGRTCPRKLDQHVGLGGGQVVVLHLLGEAFGGKLAVCPGITVKPGKVLKDGRQIQDWGYIRSSLRGI